MDYMDLLLHIMRAFHCLYFVHYGKKLYFFLQNNDYNVNCVAGQVLENLQNGKYVYLAMAFFAFGFLVGRYMN